MQNEKAITGCRLLLEKLDKEEVIALASTVTHGLLKNKVTSSEGKWQRKYFVLFVMCRVAKGNTLTLICNILYAMRHLVKSIWTCFPVPQIVQFTVRPDVHRIICLIWV